MIMAKKTTTKKQKEEVLEDILLNCRDSLRGRAALSDKRDMVLTLVFLKFISERYHDRCKEIREEMLMTLNMQKCLSPKSAPLLEKREFLC